MAPIRRDSGRKEETGSCKPEAESPKHEKRRRKVSCCSRRGHHRAGTRLSTHMALRRQRCMALLDDRERAASRLSPSLHASTARNGGAAPRISAPRERPGAIRFLGSAWRPGVSRPLPRASGRIPRHRAPNPTRPRQPGSGMCIAKPVGGTPCGDRSFEGEASPTWTCHATVATKCFSFPDERTSGREQLRISLHGGRRGRGTWTGIRRTREGFTRTCRMRSCACWSAWSRASSTFPRSAEVLRSIPTS